MLSEPQIFADKIFYYESAMSNPHQLIDQIEESDKELHENLLISKWHTWSASNDSYVFGERKTTNFDNFSKSSKIAQLIYLTLDNTLAVYGENYANTLGIRLGTKMPISISKYFPGTYMGPHTDSSQNPTTENISAVIYLNENYKGGEINFPNQNIMIKPSAGSIVIFPSIPPYYHESKEVVEGIKYMSPAFWHLF